MESYDVVRFESEVDENYLCPVCMNVLQEPVMCQRNEHYFCKACITKHLENSKTCPSCMDVLTVETLRQPPRIVTSYLFNLIIRCDFYSRGCREIVRLGDLETHVEGCGFAPVFCTNDGCLVELNKRDRTHHESEVCDFRRVKCHDCDRMREKIVNVESCLEDIKDQLGTMKELLIEMREVRAGNQGSCDPQQPQLKPRGDIIVAGGQASGSDRLRSAELFSWQKREWLPLPPMKHCCDGTSLVIFKNQVIAVGGGYTNQMETMNLNIQQESEVWMNFVLKLPNKFNRQKCLVYQDFLILSGGFFRHDNCGGRNISNSIWKILLKPPYTTQLLPMPQSRCYHGMELFNNEVFIFGGTTTALVWDSLDSVLKYNLIDNKLTEMPQLPFAAHGMATVNIGDHAILMGGCKNNEAVLNTVIMYNFNTGQSKMLPPMIHKRELAAAVMTGSVIVVMGGRNDENGWLNSVECFSFDQYSWEDLPPMREGRGFASAVSKP